jgi:PAS domain S-box-containing protein
MAGGGRKTISGIIGTVLPRRRGGLRKKMEISDKTAGFKKNNRASFPDADGIQKTHDRTPSEAEDKYRSFFENIEQGYYEIGLNGRFIFFNEFLAAIFGYTKDELYRIDYRQLIDMEDARNALQVFSDVLRTEKPRIGCVLQMVRKDKTRRQVGVSICLMKDDEGGKIGFRGIARDISERKQQEAQQSHALKLEAIGQLAAGIAHEINTPIQYISDNARFLQDSFAEIEKVFASYGNLLSSAKRGAVTDGLIREAETLAAAIDLDYLREEIPKAIGQSLEGLDNVAKIVSAMKQFSHPGTEGKAMMDVNRAVQSAVAISRNEWKYVAEIITDLDPSMPAVPGIPGEFNQVLLNMIINAAHSVADVLDGTSGEKGRITITTRRVDPWAEIRVSDTGTGIPKEIRGRIFDPFFTTKEVGKGTGQGLAISHSVIANKHGGTIEFETETGKGTTMIIRIPLSETPEAGGPNNG